MTYDNIKSATKNQGFTLSLSISLGKSKDTLMEKPHGERVKG